MVDISCGPAVNWLRQSDWIPAEVKNNNGPWRKPDERCSELRPFTEIMACERGDRWQMSPSQLECGRSTGTRKICGVVLQVGMMARV